MWLLYPDALSVAGVKRRPKGTSPPIFCGCPWRQTIFGGQNEQHKSGRWLTFGFLLPDFAELLGSWYISSPRRASLLRDTCQCPKLCLGNRRRCTRTSPRPRPAAPGIRDVALWVTDQGSFHSPCFWWLNHHHLDQPFWGFLVGSRFNCSQIFERPGEAWRWCLLPV